MDKQTLANIYISIFINPCWSGSLDQAHIELGNSAFSTDALNSSDDLLSFPNQTVSISFYVVNDFTHPFIGF